MDVSQAFLDLDDQVQKNDAILADGHDMERIVKVYVKIRDARAARSKAFEEEDKALKGQQEMLRAELLDHMNKMNVEQIGTTSGVVYRDVKMNASCEDWSLFFEWLRAQPIDQFEMMQKRLSSQTIKQFMDKNGGQLPPGVSVFKEADVKIRRK